MTSVRVLLYCCLILVAPCQVMAATFFDTWSPSTVQFDGMQIFVKKRATDTLLLMRKDPATPPTLNLNLSDLKNAIDAYRSATQELLGMGKFRTERLYLRALSGGEIQELLSAVYVDHRGRRYYMYEEVLFSHGQAYTTQISSPLPMVQGLALVQSTRLLAAAGRRGIASEVAEPVGGDVREGGCVDCVEENANYFERTYANVKNAVQKLKSQDRSVACAKVRTEKRSMLAGVIGETDYKQWDDQINGVSSGGTLLRSKLNCISGASVQFVKGFADPFIMLGKGAWWAVKKTPGAIASLFDPQTWTELSNTAKKLPEGAKNLVAGAANVGSAAFDAARDPIGTAKKVGSAAERIGQAIGKIVNAFLVDKVPEYMCMTPEARAEMICGIVGYLAGSVADPVALLKLIQLGKFEKVAQWITDAYAKVRPKFFKDDPVAPAPSTVVSEDVDKALQHANPQSADTVHSLPSDQAPPLQPEGLHESVPQAPAARSQQAALNEGAERAWAEQNPDRSKLFLNIARYDEDRKAKGLQPIAGEVANTLSKIKDPNTDKILAEINDAVTSGDEKEVNAARNFLKSLREEEAKSHGQNPSETLKNAVNDYEKMECGQ